MHFLLYVSYFTTMFSIFIFLDSQRNKIQEKNVVRDFADALMWTLMFCAIKNIWLFILGGILGVIINSYFVSKLYPTSNTTYFKRRKKAKNAVQCDVPRKEEDNKDILENENRDISKDN